MFWKISRYRAGDTVEVRSKEEILATLDARGCVDGLPFMPEMMQFCGRRFRVRAVAHKTCDTAKKTWTSRRLRSTVHLEDLRCHGAYHGGCEAACTLFWKDVWLKPVASGVHAASNGQSSCGSAGCSEAQLIASTKLPVVALHDEPCYACQATLLYDATQKLAWWDVRQYVLDVVTGNHSALRVLRVLCVAALRQPWRLLRRIPVVRQLYAPIHEGVLYLLTGRESPDLFKNVKPVVKTPVGRLDLKPGELVRIKPRREIEATLNAEGKNRGLSFDPEEMAPFCGGVFRVQRSVTKIIDEMTGKMRYMKQPCIILEGVACRAEYAPCRLNCPRAIPSYWRELWLERVTVDQSNDRHVMDRPAAALVESLE